MTTSKLDHGYSDFMSILGRAFDFKPEVIQRRTKWVKKFSDGSCLTIVVTTGPFGPNGPFALIIDMSTVDGERIFFDEFRNSDHRIMLHRLIRTLGTRAWPSPKEASEWMDELALKLHALQPGPQTGDRS